MKVNITVAGSAPFSLDVERTITVEEFKKLLVEDEHFPKSLNYETIRIIHFGKFLDDGTKTLEDYKVNENGRIIVYVQKKPAPPAPSKQPEAQAQESSTSQSNASSTGPVAPQQVQQAPILPPTQEQQQSMASPISSTTPVSNPSPSSEPVVDVEKLQQMLLMGFDEHQSRRALAASGGNVEIAVDYVLSGNIPERAAPTPLGGAGGMLPPGINITEAAVQNLLAFLQENDPETYQQVRSNPAFLAQLLAQVGVLPQQVQSSGDSSAGRDERADSHVSEEIPELAQGTAALSAELTPAEESQVREISEMTGLDHDRCKIVFVRLGRNPNVACDIIFECLDRLRTMSPAQIDFTFLQMQYRSMAAAAAQGGQEHESGAFRYDSDDDDRRSDSDEEDEEEDGGDDDFYL